MIDNLIFFVVVVHTGWFDIDSYMVILDLKGGFINKK